MATGYALAAGWPLVVGEDIRHAGARRNNTLARVHRLADRVVSGGAKAGVVLLAWVAHLLEFAEHPIFPPSMMIRAVTVGEAVDVGVVTIGMARERGGSVRDPALRLPPLHHPRRLLRPNPSAPSQHMKISMTTSYP